MSKVAVFISYFHADNQQSNYHNELVNYLKSNGIDDVWLDTRMGAGEEWENSVDQQLSRATHLILIWTPNAVESKHVTYEWSTAFILGVQIILVFAPQYPSVKLDEIPELMRKFNLIQDPISLKDNHSKLLKAFIEGGITDHCKSRFGLTMTTFQKFRLDDPKAWDEAQVEIEEWIKSSAPEVKQLEQINWLLSRIAPKNSFRSDERKRKIRTICRKIEEIIDYPEKLSQADKVQLPDGSELEFRQHIRKMANRLRSKGLDGRAIREEVKEAVAAWSLAKYNAKRPPEDELPRHKQFTSGKRRCGLCKMDDAEANHNGCCTECGLFFTFWDPDSLDQLEDTQQPKTS